MCFKSTDLLQYTFNINRRKSYVQTHIVTCKRDKFETLISFKNAIVGRQQLVTSPSSQSSPLVPPVQCSQRLRLINKCDCSALNPFSELFGAKNV